MGLAHGKAQGFFGLQANFDGSVTPLDEPVVAAAKAQHLYEKFGGYAATYPYGYGLGYAGYAPYSHVDTHVYASPVSVAAPVSYSPAYVTAAPAPVVSPAFAAHQAAIAANQLEREQLFVLQAAEPAPIPQITAAPAPAPVAATFEAAPVVTVEAAPARPTVTRVKANPGSTVFETRKVVQTNPTSQAAFDEVLEANQLARAELLAIQAGGLYASVYGNDPYAGLVRHASGAVTPPEPAANIEARRKLFEAQRALRR